MIFSSVSNLKSFDIKKFSFFCPYICLADSCNAMSLSAAGTTKSILTIISLVYLIKCQIYTKQHENFQITNMKVHS